MKILHVITGLNVGGAESQLCGLCEDLQRHGVRQRVVSLLPKGPLTARVHAAGVDCVHLGLRQDRPDFSGLAMLCREMRDYQPDIVHSWMYHSCLYSSIAVGFLGSNTPHLW